MIFPKAYELLTSSFDLVQYYYSSKDLEGPECQANGSPHAALHQYGSSRGLVGASVDRQQVPHVLKVEPLQVAQSAAPAAIVGPLTRSVPPREPFMVRVKLSAKMLSDGYLLPHPSFPLDAGLLAAPAPASLPLTLNPLAPPGAVGDAQPFPTTLHWIPRSLPHPAAGQPQPQPDAEPSAPTTNDMLCRLYGMNSWFRDQAVRQGEVVVVIFTPPDHFAVAVEAAAPLPELLAAAQVAAALAAKGTGSGASPQKEEGGVAEPQPGGIKRPSEWVGGPEGAAKRVRQQGADMPDIVMQGARTSTDGGVEEREQPPPSRPPSNCQPPSSPSGAGSKFSYDVRYGKIQSRTDADRGRVRATPAMMGPGGVFSGLPPGEVVEAAMADEESGRRWQVTLPYSNYILIREGDLMLFSAASQSAAAPQEGCRYAFGVRVFHKATMARGREEGAKTAGAGGKPEQLPPLPGEPAEEQLPLTHGPLCLTLDSSAPGGVEGVGLAAGVGAPRCGEGLLTPRAGGAAPVGTVLGSAGGSGALPGSGSGSVLQHSTPGGGAGVDVNILMGDSPVDLTFSPPELGAAAAGDLKEGEIGSEEDETSSISSGLSAKGPRVNPPTLYWGLHWDLLYDLDGPVTELPDLRSKPTSQPEEVEPTKSNQQPPAKVGGQQPPTKAGAHQPPAKAGAHQPPAKAGGQNPKPPSAKPPVPAPPTPPPHIYRSAPLSKSDISDSRFTPGADMAGPQGVLGPLAEAAYSGPVKLWTDGEGEGRKDSHCWEVFAQSSQDASCNFQLNGMAVVFAAFGAAEADGMELSDMRLAVEAGEGEGGGGGDAIGYNGRWYGPLPEYRVTLWRAEKQLYVQPPARRHTHQLPTQLLPARGQAPPVSAQGPAAPAPLPPLDPTCCVRLLPMEIWDGRLMPPSSMLAAGGVLEPLAATRYRGPVKLWTEGKGRWGGQCFTVGTESGFPFQLIGMAPVYGALGVAADDELEVRMMVSGGQGGGWSGPGSIPEFCLKLRPRRQTSQILAAEAGMAVTATAGGMAATCTAVRGGAVGQQAAQGAVGGMGVTAAAPETCEMSGTVFKKNPYFKKLYVSKCGKLAAFDPKSGGLGELWVPRVTRTAKNPYVDFTYWPHHGPSKVYRSVHVRHLVASTWMSVEDVKKLWLDVREHHEFETRYRANLEWNLHFIDGKNGNVSLDNLELYSRRSGVKPGKGGGEAKT